MMDGYVSVEELKNRLLAMMEINLVKSKRFSTWAKQLSVIHYDRAVAVHTIANELLGIDLLDGADENMLKLLGV